MLLPFVKNDDGKKEIVNFINYCVLIERIDIVKHLLRCLLETNCSENGAPYKPENDPVLLTKARVQLFLSMKDLMLDWIIQDQILPFIQVMGAMEQIVHRWIGHKSQEHLKSIPEKDHQHQELCQQIKEFRQFLWLEAIYSLNANFIRFMYANAKQWQYEHDLNEAMDENSNTILHLLYKKISCDNPQTTEEVLKINNLLEKLLGVNVWANLLQRLNRNGWSSIALLIAKIRDCSNNSY